MWQRRVYNFTLLKFADQWTHLLKNYSFKVHRRLLNDDKFGVAEPLNEIEFEQGLVTRGQHFLTFGNSNPDSERKKNVRTLLEDTAFF